MVCCAVFSACGDDGEAPSKPRRDAGAHDAGEPRDAGETDAAGSAADAAAVSCDATAPVACPSPGPRYSDVSPIFSRRCAGCHSGAGEQWPLNSYEHVADWYGEIRAQMLACTMPPPTSGIEMPLAERQTILDWIRCGFPK